MQLNDSREMSTLKCINHNGSHAQVACRKEKESSSFPLPLPPPPNPTASSLNRAFACHLKWGWCQSITFLSSRRVWYSLSQTVLGIWRENSSYLHTKQRTLWLHVSSLTHLNQLLPINNTTALTRAWHTRKSSHTKNNLLLITKLTIETYLQLISLKKKTKYSVKALLTSHFIS